MPADGSTFMPPADGSSSVPWWAQLLNVGGQIATDVLYPSSPTGGTYYPPYTPPFSGGTSGGPFAAMIQPFQQGQTSGLLLIGGAVLLLLLLRKR